MESAARSLRRAGKARHRTSVEAVSPNVDMTVIQLNDGTKANISGGQELPRGRNRVRDAGRQDYPG